MEHLVDLVLLAGEVLLTCGAEMYRVEETAERMGKAAGFSQVEVFATPTGLFMSLHTRDGQVFTRVRRIRVVDNNLAKIAEVNSLSRAFSEGKLTTSEAMQQLQELRADIKAPWVLNLAGGVGSGAFALMYGGTLLDALSASIIGVLVLSVVYWLNKYPVPRVLHGAVGASCAALVGTLLSEVLPLTVDVVILGSVMVLVPGVVMTTAIRDMLSGELVSGVSRSAEAVAIAVSVAAGAALVLSIRGGA